MTEVTIGTFNAENLFTRFKFKGRRVRKPAPPNSGKKFTYEYVPYTAEELREAVSKGFIIDPKTLKRYLPAWRTLTARAIKAVDADILGVQEVENLDVLKLFNARHMGSKKYRYPYLIDGNDNRFIDVGVLSRYPVTHLVTHQFRRKGRSEIFARDCLEVHFDIDGKPFALFVNHFTSMMRGRPQSKPRREGQSAEVLKILRERFGAGFGQANFAVVGDLNDYVERGRARESGIRSLLASNQMENVIGRLPADDRWTHFYNGDKTYHQLDYILLSKALADRNKDRLPVIERRGQPLRVNQKNKPPKVKKFFPGIQGKLKASDHCPVAITIRL